MIPPYEYTRLTKRTSTRFLWLTTVVVVEKNEWGKSPRGANLNRSNRVAPIHNLTSLTLPSDVDRETATGTTLEFDLRRCFP